MDTNDDVTKSSETAETDPPISNLLRAIWAVAEPDSCFDTDGLCGGSAMARRRAPADLSPPTADPSAANSCGIVDPAVAFGQITCIQQALTHTTIKQLRHDLRQGWHAILNLLIEEAFQIAASIEPVLADLPRQLSDRFWNEIQVMRAAGFALLDQSSTAMALVMRVQRGPLAPQLSRLAEIVSKYCDWKAGNLDRLYLPRRQRVVGRVSRREAEMEAFELSIEAASELQHLKLNTAKRLAGDALEMARTRAGHTSMARTLAATLVGQIAYEEGDLDRAERAFLRIAPDRSPIECLLRAYPICARIAVHRGQPAHAMQLLMEGEQLGESKGSSRLIAICLQEQVGISIDRGAFDNAKACLERISTVASSQHREMCGRRSPVEMHCALAAARVRLALARSRSEAAVLRQLHQDALEWNDFYASIGLALRLVEALQIIGETQDAASMLARTLRVGMNTGMFQTFIDSGRHVRALLVGVQRDAKPEQCDLMPFLNSLMRRFPPGLVDNDVQRCVPFAKKVLTQRENLVMRLIGHGLSNKLIARELDITPETVKSHAKHIFAKLNVRTRAQAVARAATLRLI